MTFFPAVLNKWLVTWFGCGRVPVAPGTAGSIGALPVCWLLSAETNLPFRILVAVGVTAIAILASAQDQLSATKGDPGYVVIDEVAGMLWSTLLISASWLPMLVAFGLFRLLDVLKPFPANIFDRKSKTAAGPLRRGAYIVLDDVVAGLYTALITYGIVQHGIPALTR